MSWIVNNFLCETYSELSDRSKEVFAQIVGTIMI